MELAQYSLIFFVNNCANFSNDLFLLFYYLFWAILSNSLGLMDLSLLTVGMVQMQKKIGYL